MPILLSGDSSQVDTGWGTPGASHGPIFAHLGGINVGSTDMDGVEWVLTGLTGWFDPPSTTGDVEQRAADHGGWAGPAHLAPRQVTLEGHVAGPWSVLSRALAELNAAVPLSGLAPLTVEDADGTQTQAWVRQGGDVLHERHPQAVNFSLSLIAPDPRRYSVGTVTASTGLPQTSGGLVLPATVPFTIDATVDSGILKVENEGNFGARPTLTVRGPVPPFTITHRATGQTLRYHEYLPAGRTLVIDTDKRRALLDGQVPRRVTGSWFEYGPGDNELAFNSQIYNEASLLTSEHRSAWR